MSTCHGLISILAVRQHRHQDLSQHMKASFSQSEEVFSRSHITMSYFACTLYFYCDWRFFRSKSDLCAINEKEKEKGEKNQRRAFYDHVMSEIH